jgi:hypothetical protein
MMKSYVCDMVYLGDGGEGLDGEHEEHEYYQGKDRSYSFGWFVTTCMLHVACAIVPHVHDMRLSRAYCSNSNQCTNKHEDSCSQRQLPTDDPKPSNVYPSLRVV